MSPDAADATGVRFDLVHPTPRQLRDGVTCGLIAESIMVPILLTLTFVDHSTVRWGYMFGAIACIVVSIGYQAVYGALPSPGSSDGRFRGCHSMFNGEHPRRATASKG